MWSYPINNRKGQDRNSKDYRHPNAWFKALYPASCNYEEKTQQYHQYIQKYNTGEAEGGINSINNYLVKPVEIKISRNATDCKTKRIHARERFIFNDPFPGM